MSETVLKMLLSELQTLRIVCQQCNTATEISIARFADRTGRSHGMRCPGCGLVFRTSGDAMGQHPDEDAFDQLAAAWRSLAALGNLQIEFIVRQKS